MVCWHAELCLVEPQDERLRPAFEKEDRTWGQAVRQHLQPPTATKLHYYYSSSEWNRTEKELVSSFYTSLGEKEKEEENF